jgi:asparagine synthase (glutamine-hydrolysing)
MTTAGSARIREGAGADLYARLKRRFSGLRLSKLARSVRQQKLTYLSDAKLLRLEEALAAAEQVEGAFLEFGVALGGSAILIANTATRANKPFVGFDVFGMIPPPTSDKDDRRSKERYETIARGQAAGIGGEVYYGYRDNLYEDVVRAFSRNGLTVDGEQIVLVKGLFEDTWPTVEVASVAFCHVDCDWYDPVKFCLTSIAPKLARGGVILLDDYHDYGGCRQAADEFLKMNPEFMLSDGPNVIVRRSGALPS